MTGATFANPPHRLPVTRLRLGRVLFVLLLVVSLGIGSTVWLLRTKARQLSVPIADATGWPGWMKQANLYEPPKEVPVLPPPPQRDLLAEQLAALRQQLEDQRQAIEALKRRPVPPPAATPPPPAKAAAPVVVKPHASMFFVENTLPKEKREEETRYTLAPGATKIPCLVETNINSDVENIMTAKVTTAVWDTATGKHLLIPQGSTIVGKYQSAGLLYGNQRLPMVSTTLTLPDGRSTTLDEAPVLDQQGTAGLVSAINNHWWRNFGAVIIQGVLRGGAQAVQLNAGAGQGNVIGQVGTGITSSTTQYGQQVLTRFIDTRPTIEVFAGEGCVIILTKELRLPALWQ